MELISDGRCIGGIDVWKDWFWFGCYRVSGVVLFSSCIVDECRRLLEWLRVKKDFHRWWSSEF